MEFLLSFGAEQQKQ